MQQGNGAAKAYLSVLCAIALCAACGGPPEKARRSSRAAQKRDVASTPLTTGKPVKASDSDKAAERERRAEAKKERKLRKQQAALCEKVCDRLLECQLSYARANLTPDIVAAMKKPAERKKMETKCREERQACGDGDPDEEQLDKTRACLRKKTCAAAIQCLDS